MASASTAQAHIGSLEKKSSVVKLSNRRIVESSNGGIKELSNRRIIESSHCGIVEW